MPISPTRSEPLEWMGSSVAPGKGAMRAPALQAAVGGTPRRSIGLVASLDVSSTLNDSSDSKRLLRRPAQSGRG